MRLVFMGTPEFAVPSLDALVSAGHDVCGVFTQPDKPKGRGMEVGFSPVKEYCIHKNIPVYQPVSLRKPGALETLANLNPELIVVVAYGKLLPDAVLNLPEKGCVNVHASLLPELRGAAPIQWAVARGYETTGITTMYMASELDTGDIILKREVDIGKKDTAGTMHDKLKILGAELLKDTLTMIEARIAPCIPQDNSKATFAPIIVKDNGKIDWSRSASELDAHIRGMSPWPGAFSGQLKIHSAERVGKKSAKPAGTVEDSYYVVCGDGECLKLTEIQKAGGRRMNASEFIRGHSIEALI